MKDDYIRKGVVSEIVDGDTVKVSLDLGFTVWVSVSLRLLDVYAYETKGVEKEMGAIDKKKLEKLLPLGEEVLVQTFKTKGGKEEKSFDRYIGVISSKGVRVNDLLNKKGGIGVKKK